MADNVKPCPFCGNCANHDPVLSEWYGCANEDCPIPFRCADSLDTWNTRAETPEMRAIRSALKIMGDNSESCRRIALTNDCDKFNERHATYRMSIRIILEQLAKEGVTHRQKSPWVNPER